jgi:hypothetical protein
MPLTSGTRSRAPCRRGEAPGKKTVEKTVTHTTKERGTISPLAGKPAPKSILVDLNEAEGLVNTAIGDRP